MPLDYFPIEAIERAALAETWLVDLCDVSEETPGRGYDVSIFTPALLARGSEAIEDLRYWSLELGEYPPIVIVRIQPKVGQSLSGFLANVILGALSSATNTYYRGIYAPAARGDLRGIVVQDATGLVRPIQVRRARAVLDGQLIEVAHVILPAQMFAPDEEGHWTSSILNITDAKRGLTPWIFPEKTMRQVYEDFREYLAR